MSCSTTQDGIPSAQHTLLRISTITRSIISTCKVDTVAKRTVSPVQVHCDMEFPLLPPPPISDLLPSSRLHPRLSSKLSRHYERYASQLRSNFERSLRRAIPACKQFSLPGSVPAFDSAALVDAVSSMYLRTLRDMAIQVIAVQEKYLQGSNHDLRISRSVALTARHYSSTFPYGAPQQIATTPLRSSGSRPTKASRYVQQHTSSSCDERLDNASPETIDTARNYPTNLIAKEPDVNSAYCRHKRTVHAFPAQYTHPEVLPSRTFASSSETFFSKARRSSSGLSSRNANDSVAIGVFEKMAGLSLQNRTVSVGIDARLHPANARACVLSNPTTTPISPRIDLEQSPSSYHVTTDPSLKVTRRKYASMPKRAARSEDRDMDRCALTSSSLSLSRIAPAPPPYSTGPDLSSVSPSPHDTTISPSTVPMGRRKVAPLPRRQPLSPSAGPQWLHSTQARSKQQPSRQAFLIISRTPSLTSLASSEDSSNSLDDDFDTAPSSPSLERYTSLGSTNPSLDFKRCPQSLIGESLSESYIREETVSFSPAKKFQSTLSTSGVKQELET